MENLIDGRRIAAEIHAETQQRVQRLREKGIQPGLVFIRVGEDPASRVYVGMKEKKSQELGIASSTVVLDESTTQADLLNLIERYNRDEAIHGILVQAPLPSHIDETVVFSSVDPSKDVDGFIPSMWGSSCSISLEVSDPVRLLVCMNY